MAVTHTILFRNEVADLIGDDCDSGLLVFRIAASTAETPGTEVATLTFAAAAFPAASGGTITAGTITQDSSATGNASPIAYATVETSVAAVKAHCEVAASGSDIDLTNGLTVTAGDIVSCSALTYTAMA